MENTKDQGPLVKELSEKRELVQQLRIHLDPSSSNGEHLIEKILTSLSRALFLLKGNGCSEQNEPADIQNTATIAESDSTFMTKKRKTIHRWSQRVCASPESTLEESHDDGYRWRKYGQKLIIGAIHPRHYIVFYVYCRGYYRCTHSNYQGCKAKKQVQRTDDDATIIEISYQGKHTCTQAPYVNIQGLQQDQEKRNPNEIIFNFQTGLKVKTRDLNTNQELTPRLSFPLTISSMEETKDEKPEISPLKPDDSFMDIDQFISPTLSELDYYSPYHMNTFDDERGIDFTFELTDIDYTSDFLNFGH
ncbi:hypothetical protein GIB67_028843 [Kingdonia uniflora]|uniref:WRKY domain-containing protein n=1 Tax=Kingdonia uniflora TaxID=39325 RepID=A0A7J7LTG5_9MAGN|nr:hypothetical protein GIB67_028843 [Kingdonia uniflora]